MAVVAVALVGTVVAASVTVDSAHDVVDEFWRVECRRGYFGCGCGVVDCDGMWAMYCKLESAGEKDVRKEVRHSSW